jgi:hypothetical protein
MKILLRLCLCFTALLASAQHLVKQEVFDAIANEYSGEAAQENTRRIQTVTKLSFRMMLWFFRSIIVCEMESKEERVSLGGEGCGETISAEHLDHAF